MEHTVTVETPEGVVFIQSFTDEEITAIYRFIHDTTRKLQGGIVLHQPPIPAEDATDNLNDRTLKEFVSRITPQAKYDVRWFSNFYDLDSAIYVYNLFSDGDSLVVAPTIDGEGTYDLIRQRIIPNPLNQYEPDMPEDDEVEFLRGNIHPDHVDLVAIIEAAKLVLS